MWLFLVAVQAPHGTLCVACNGGGLLFNNLLKEFFERPRPGLVPYATAAAMSSFPSGHAMMSTVWGEP
ncbi:MAG: phosphatase PAP2 family protein, partial [Gammaproteobacteria bacterium]|nr:phosphatase PAP2 family protein [Gammaproteobacteria bacterium]